MANPARYAMLVISEGAIMQGGAVMEYGEADEHGRRRLGGIGEALGAEIASRTGIGTINQSLAYLMRSEEHTSELQSLMRISYAVFCLKKTKKKRTQIHKT